MKRRRRERQFKVERHMKGRAGSYTDYTDRMVKKYVDSLCSAGRKLILKMFL
jgi:hypothetical protein